MNMCMVSIDVEQDLGQETFCGVENLDGLMEIFNESGIRSTLFVTGKVLERYAGKVKEWSRHHEIGCHGYYHVPLYTLSLPERKEQLKTFSELYEGILGGKPKGFRAVQHSIDNYQLKLIEEFGFEYDSSVIPRYIPVRKDVGYKGKAPAQPYYPDCKDYREQGSMGILEIPASPLLLGIPLQGTWIRVLGLLPYRLLLRLKKPPFISLSMHSWDAIEYSGAWSRNSGPEFLKLLSDLLQSLTESYEFVSGDDILKAYCCTGE